MNNKNQINITYIIIAIIIGVAIIGFGVLNYISDEKNREVEQSKIDQTQLKTQLNKNSLEECLLQAEKEYDSSFELNSSPNPQEGYPNARKWNSVQIRDNTIKKLQDDKTLCAKLYGN